MLSRDVQVEENGSRTQRPVFEDDTTDEENDDDDTISKHAENAESVDSASDKEDGVSVSARKSLR